MRKRNCVAEVHRCASRRPRGCTQVRGAEGQSICLFSISRRQWAAVDGGKISLERMFQHFQFCESCNSVLGVFPAPGVRDKSEGSILRKGVHFHSKLEESLNSRASLANLALRQKTELTLFAGGSKMLLETRSEHLPSKHETPKLPPTCLVQS